MIAATFAAVERADCVLCIISATLRAPDPSLRFRPTGQIGPADAALLYLQGSASAEIGKEVQIQVFGISAFSLSPSGRYATAPERSPKAHGLAQPGKFIRPHDALAVLLVWAISVCLSLFVAPHYGEASTPELLYYTVYNVSVGALVGFYLFDRLPKNGVALFVLRASCAILLGTLVNESVVEPVFFGAGPINGEGVYYGLTGVLWTTGLFLLLRLAEWQYVLRQRVQSEPKSRSCPDSVQVSSTPLEAHTAFFFVRVAGGTRRIYAPDVLYMKAERDFTRIVCANGEHFVSESLKSLLSKSAVFGLARVHKSFAVNINRVERLRRTEVQLGKFRVPVGRRYRSAFAETWRTRSAPVATN